MPELPDVPELPDEPPSPPVGPPPLDASVVPPAFASGSVAPPEQPGMTVASVASTEMEAIETGAMKVRMALKIRRPFCLLSDTFCHRDGRHQGTLVGDLGIRTASSPLEWSISRLREHPDDPRGEPGVRSEARDSAAALRGSANLALHDRRGSKARVAERPGHGIRASPTDDAGDPGDGGVLSAQQHDRDLDPEMP